MPLLHGGGGSSKGFLGRKGLKASTAWRLGGLLLRNLNEVTIMAGYVCVYIYIGNSRVSPI